MHNNIESAFQEAEQSSRSTYKEHVYIFRVGREYGVHWRGEDRYVSDGLPDGAQIIWHGKRRRNLENDDSIITWDKRARNTPPDEVNILADFMGIDKNTVESLLDEFGRE